MHILTGLLIGGILGRKRGLYVLTYFKASGTSITGLERDAKLSDSILRILVVRADGISRERMEAATLGGVAQEPREERGPEAPAEPEAAAPAEDKPAEPPAAGEQAQLVGTPTDSDSSVESST